MTDIGSASFIQQLRISEILRRFMLGFLISTLFGGMARAQTEELPLHIDGDIGLGSYYTRSIIHGKTDQVSVLPYGNFDYDRIVFVILTRGSISMTFVYGFFVIACICSQDGFYADVIRLHGLG